MNIYTLNVGQGQFVVVTGTTEAIIIDTSIPKNPKHPIIHVMSALSNILKGKSFIGLIVTGFDSDHFNEIGVKIALNKYRPNWVMYPRYYKRTDSADAGFAAITAFEKTKDIKKYSIQLGENNRRLYNGLSSDFSFEIFSPHKEDMNSSNNCSIVCKITEKATGGSYLVTGDTENERWDSIVKIFGSSIKSDVLDAPHHGSKNGVTKEAIKLIKPHTVLISAGVENQYAHPDKEAMDIFSLVTDKIYSTNGGNGQSLRTEITKNGVNTYLFE